MGARIRRPSGSSPRSITRIWGPVRHVFRTHSTVGLSLRGEVASLTGDGADDLTGESRRSRFAPHELPGSSAFAEDSPVDFLVDGVARAGGELETVDIENRDVATAVADEFSPLQRAGRTGDA